MQLQYWGLLVGLWHLPADQLVLKDWSNKSCLLAMLQQENMTVCLTWLSDHLEKEKKSSIVQSLCYRLTITVKRCSYFWCFEHCKPFHLLVFEVGVGIWTTNPYNISENTYFFGKWHSKVHQYRRSKLILAFIVADQVIHLLLRWEKVWGMSDRKCYSWACVLVGRKRW